MHGVRGGTFATFGITFPDRIQCRKQLVRNRSRKSERFVQHLCLIVGLPPGQLMRDVPRWDDGYSPKSREPEEEVAATLLKTSEVSSGGGTKVAPPGVSSRGAVLPVWSLELVICVHLTDDKSVPNLLLGFIINGQHH